MTRLVGLDELKNPMTSLEIETAETGNGNLPYFVLGRKQEEREATVGDRGGKRLNTNTAVERQRENSSACLVLY
jgi:hypothetical protein